MLPRFDRVQVCSPENGNYLLSFLPGLRGRIDDNRAGIATSRYEFQANGREPETMLFLGSFRHPPNQEGLNWFTQKVLPAVLEHKPQRAAGDCRIGAAAAVTRSRICRTTSSCEDLWRTCASRWADMPCLFVRS